MSMLESPILSNPLFDRQTCCLSSQETSRQVPETDIARISFYLRCCVLGCGLADGTLPEELIDFSNAHNLPLDWQNMIYRLSFEDFGLCNLLGRVVHVDADQRLLGPGVSTMFLQANTPEYVLAMNCLGIITPNLPLLYTGNVMICSSEWIQDHHILPFQRYVASLAPVPTVDQYASAQRQENEYIHQPQHSSSCCPTCSSPNKKVETCAQFHYDQMTDDDDNIPMVAAIPLEQRHDDVSASLIVPGQQVRLFGLETDEMNDAMGIVQERKDNRVIVKVANHQCKYSVRIENLIIVQEALATSLC